MKVTGKYRKEIRENKSLVAQREKKNHKSSPKNVFVDDLLSQLLTLRVNSGEVAQSMQVSLPQAGTAAQRELQVPSVQKARPEALQKCWGFLSVPVRLQGDGRGNTSSSRGK